MPGCLKMYMDCGTTGSAQPTALASAASRGDSSEYLECTAAGREEEEEEEEEEKEKGSYWVVSLPTPHKPQLLPGVWCVWRGHLNHFANSNTKVESARWFS